jgi:transposase
VVDPGVYFRCLLVGYFEGIDFERGIAWRCADSRSLGLFPGMAVYEAKPDHSTISRTRRLIDLATHQDVLAYMLKVLANQDLIDGKTIRDHTGPARSASCRGAIRNVSSTTAARYTAPGPR